MASFTLTILTGPQEGSTLPLTPARRTFGKAETCTIAINDPSVADTHVETVFLEDKLILLRAHETVRLDGEVVQEFPQDVEPLQVITLGATSFTYAEPRSPLPSPEEVAEMLARAAPDDENPNATPPPPPTDTGAEASTEAPPRRRVRRVLVTASLTLATFLLASVVVVSMLSTPVVNRLEDAMRTGSLPSMPEPETPAEPMPSSILVDRIKLDTPAFEYVQLVSENTIGGYVRTNADLNSLRQAFLGTGFAVRTRSLQQVERSLAILLDQDNSFLTAKTELLPSGTIHLKVAGLVSNADGVTAFEKNLRRELPYVRTFHVEVMTHRDVMRIASNLMVDHPALRELRMEVDQNGVAFHGTLLANFADTLTEVSSALREKLPDTVPLRDLVQVSPYFPATLLSVHLSPTSSHARLAWPNAPAWDNVYRENDSLPRGFTVKTITRDGLTLSNGENSFFLPLSL